MKYQEIAVVTENKKITSDVFDLYLSCENIPSSALPGQFVNLYLEDGATLLPRPISIAGVKGNVLRFIIQIVGKGTKALSQLKTFDTVRIFGPLGNSYQLPKQNSASCALVSGGVGFAPLLFLSDFLKGDVHLFAGFQKEISLPQDCMDKKMQVHTITDIGPLPNGNVLDLLITKNIYMDQMYACGPTKMLQALQTYAQTANIPLQLSLEARMACGFGVCVGCSVPIKKDGEVVMRKVCQDGCIFDAKEVIIPC